MAITQAMVIKLVLDHIGGSKITGNPAAVNIGGALAMVKAGGMSSLTSGVLGGAISGLTAQFGSIAAITSALQANPLTSVMATVTEATSSLQSQLSAITNLPGTLSTALTTSLGSVTTALTSLTTHSNLLSGLVLATESIPEGQLALTDLTSLGGIAMSSLGMTQEEVLASAGSLSANPLLEQIQDSLNPNTPSAITDLVNELAVATDAGALEAELTVISDQLVAAIDVHAAEINDLIAADVAAQADLKLRVDALNTLATILPDPSNAIATAMFDLVATDTLRDLNTTLTANTT